MTRFLFAAATAATLIYASGALAMGGGGGGGGGGSAGGGSHGSPTPIQTPADAASQDSDAIKVCAAGQVYDTKSKKCLRRTSRVLPDDQLADYAFALAKAHRYAEALKTLDLLKDPNTAEALNYRGYATRKLGRWDEGVGYYKQSIALDPNYAQVREYLGEAYVEKGEIALASDQLSEIGRICGAQDCEAYEKLKAAIRGAQL